MGRRGSGQPALRRGKAAVFAAMLVVDSVDIVYAASECLEVTLVVTSRSAWLDQVPEAWDFSNSGFGHPCCRI